MSSQPRLAVVDRVYTRADWFPKARAVRSARTAGERARVAEAKLPTVDRYILSGGPLNDSDFQAILSARIQELASLIQHSVESRPHSNF